MSPSDDRVALLRREVQMRRGNYTAAYDALAKSRLRLGEALMGLTVGQKVSWVTNGVTRFGTITSIDLPHDDTVSFADCHCRILIDKDSQRSVETITFDGAWFRQHCTALETDPRPTARQMVERITAVTAASPTPTPVVAP